VAEKIVISDKFAIMPKTKQGNFGRSELEKVVKIYDGFMTVVGVN